MCCLIPGISMLWLLCCKSAEQVQVEWLALLMWVVAAAEGVGVSLVTALKGLEVGLD